MADTSVVALPWRFKGGRADQGFLYFPVVDRPLRWLWCRDCSSKSLLLGLFVFVSCVQEWALIADCIIHGSTQVMPEQTLSSSSSWPFQRETNDMWQVLTLCLCFVLPEQTNWEAGAQDHAGPKNAASSSLRKWRMSRTGPGLKSVECNSKSDPATPPSTGDNSLKTEMTMLQLLAFVIALFFAFFL